MSKLTDFEERLQHAYESKIHRRKAMFDEALRLAREIWGGEDKNDLAYYKMKAQEWCDRIRELEAENKKLKAEMEEYRDLWAKAQLAEGVYSGLKRLYNEQGSELVSLKKQLAQAQGKRLSRVEFRAIMCEFVPTINEDDGQPEWSQGELNRAFDALLLCDKHWKEYLGTQREMKEEVWKCTMKDVVC